MVTLNRDLLSFSKTTNPSGIYAVRYTGQFEVLEQLCVVLCQFKSLCVAETLMGACEGGLSEHRNYLLVTELIPLNPITCALLVGIRIA